MTNFAHEYDYTRQYIIYPFNDSFPVYRLLYVQTTYPKVVNSTNSSNFNGET